MWQMNQTQQLTVNQPESTWLRVPFLSACETVARELRITGSQTLSSRQPADETSDYLCFSIVLNSTEATGIEFGYVLDDTTTYSQRPSSITEALAELAHGAAFGDTAMEASLLGLVGRAEATVLERAAASHS